MGKISSADKKQLLKILIVIYSFNSTNPDLFKMAMQLDDETIAKQLALLTEMGILGGGLDGKPKNILVKRDGAREILNKNNIIYTEVEYNEHIYQYQKQIMRTAPGSIEVPEIAIKVSPADMIAASENQVKNERFEKKIIKIRNYLFYLLLLLGGIATLVVCEII